MLVFQVSIVKPDSSAAVKQDSTAAKRAPVVGGKEWLAQVKGMIQKVTDWVNDINQMNQPASRTPVNDVVYTNALKKLNEHANRLNVALKESNLDNFAFERASSRFDALEEELLKSIGTKKIEMGNYLNVLKGLSNELSNSGGKQIAPANKLTKGMAEKATQEKIGMKDVPVKTETGGVSVDKIEGWIGKLPKEKSAAINRKVGDLMRKYGKSRQEVLKATEVSINADAGPVKNNALSSEGADKYQLLDTFISNMMLRRHLREKK